MNIQETRIYKFMNLLPLDFVSYLISSAIILFVVWTSGYSFHLFPLEFEGPNNTPVMTWFFLPHLFTVFTWIGLGVSISCLITSKFSGKKNGTEQNQKHESSDR